MRNRIVAGVIVAAVGIAQARAQDVPGIEICTVEKTMERRTSCLQSNVDFLHKTIGKLALDHQQKLDAANRQIEALKAALIALQKNVDQLQASKKPETPPAPAKEAPPPSEGAAPKPNAK